MSKVCSIREAWEDTFDIHVLRSILYSLANGYKMFARLYLNGDGIGQETPVAILRGGNDSLLPWPFQQKIILVVIDQHGQNGILKTFWPDPSSSSFERPKSEMNVASGCPKFVPLESGKTLSIYTYSQAFYILLAIATRCAHDCT